MEISHRIQAVASFVTPGLTVADIGCDHGYTTIYLLREGIAPKVYAMDINKGPLERAVQNIERAGLQGQVVFRLSDGMEKLLPDEAGCLLLSGMGGILIRDILSRSPAVVEKAAELVLQPQSELGILRHYLHDRGYCIVRESMLLDAGKYYTVMKAVKGEEQYEGEMEYRYGRLLLEKRSDVFVEWLKKELARMDAIVEGMKDKKGERSHQRYKDLCENIEFIQGYLKGRYRADGRSM